MSEHWSPTGREYLVEDEAVGQEDDHRVGIALALTPVLSLGPRPKAVVGTHQSRQNLPEVHGH